MLNILKKDFELIVFTAGNRQYANAVTSKIQTTQRYFDYVLARDVCTLHPHGYNIKDLRLLLDERSIKDIIIVDNKAVSFALHFTNGVPINDYEGDKTDQTLRFLTQYLLKFKNEEDVRKKLQKDFELSTFIEKRKHLKLLPSNSCSP